MSEGIFLLILLVILLVCMFSGVSLGFSLVITCFAAGILGSGINVDPTFIYSKTLGAFNNYTILAVPMFVLSGILMSMGGISKRLFDFFAYFFGRVPAGMPMCVVATALFFGAISGSGPATVAAVGAMSIPMLTSLGYSKAYAAALITVAGGLGVIIPPSIPFLMYGSVSGASAGDMFIAGVLPGLLIGGLMMVYCFAYSKVKGEERELIEANFRRIRDKGFWKMFKESFWALLSPVIILGGIYGGIVTPTEASAISVFYALFVSLVIYKDMTIKDMPKCLVQTIESSAPAMLVVAMAITFGKVLTLLQVPQFISNGILGLTSSKFGVLLIINLVLIICGMLMNVTSCILILTPIMLPLANAVGINTVHFGIIMVVNLAIGFVTPPVGSNLFVGSSMTGIPLMTLAKKCVPLLLMFLIALVLINVFPQISLLLVG